MMKNSICATGYWTTRLTSNPSIFEKAIAGIHDYDKTIHAMAHDTAGTLAEAHHLWAAVNRPNLLVIEPLIGPETINTMPPETLAAYRQHGKPALTVEEGKQEAYRVLEALPRVAVTV